ncbi:hypothetical protein M011DRAFT_157977 [Sporormia fimetaria CBS 119925]|uniref:Uncharacterized protein n=1 Tax=Sporormia fimetaria CBS 119925 TaxID=1340428 RepID=A0A6A6V516_9PLEO|nr:hypothetical protein M011DRAFT_157977 [Sporormia fimetaria CBS 119925]
MLIDHLATWRNRSSFCGPHRYSDSGVFHAANVRTAYAPSTLFKLGRLPVRHLIFDPGKHSSTNLAFASLLANTPESHIQPHNVQFACALYPAADQGAPPCPGRPWAIGCNSQGLRTPSEPCGLRGFEAVQRSICRGIRPLLMHMAGDSAPEFITAQHFQADTRRQSRIGQ